MCERIVAERTVSWIIARQCGESAWRRSCNLNRPCHPKTDPSFLPLIFDQISESGAQLITARYYCGSDINLSLRVQPNFPRYVNVGARRCGAARRDVSVEREQIYTQRRTRCGARGTLQFSIDISRFIRDRVFCIGNYESKRAAMFAVAYARFDNRYSITSLSMKTAAQTRPACVPLLRTRF